MPDNIVVIKFEDSKVPVFKETRNLDYVKYGEDNMYPNYLTHLFNKSAKHNAIVSGTANYVFGRGFKNGDFLVNSLDETLNDITKKICLDLKLYGGFRLEILWGIGGTISEMYHVDFTTIRKCKDGGFYYKESWDVSNRDERIFIPSFNPKNPSENQLYAYDEYRPNTRYYPLPDYIGCNNWIETDIEISKYYLSTIRNGMMPSKMFQFFNGEPTNEAKKDIERSFTKKFAGAENAGKFVLVFNKNRNEEVKVDDLSASDLDKHFEQLNKTCQQEIFSGHKVTSEMLFGIKTEGQLGGNGELEKSYQIFQNTYTKIKADAISKEITYLFSFTKRADEYTLTPPEPIVDAIKLDSILDILPKSFILEKAGVPSDLLSDENKGIISENLNVNENLKGLTGRQYQQLVRIINNFKKGKISEATARTLLKTSLGLKDAEIDSLLEIKSKFSEDERITLLDSFGDSADDFEIVASKKVSFSVSDIADDEDVYKEAFKTFDITKTEQALIDLLSTDGKLSYSEIASKLNVTTGYVESKVNLLLKKGYIERNDEGALIVPPKIKEIKVDEKKPVEIFIRYSYDGPQDSKNRPFCAKILSLRRIYSRADIQKISERLGYDVFDRRGGFWNDGGVVKPHCRHNWKSNIVVKK